MKLFFWGKKSKEYRGWDIVNDKNVHVKQGSAIEVSDVKAQQLLKDYPGEFEIVPGEENQATQVEEPVAEQEQATEPLTKGPRGRKKKNG